ncbi:MAG: hypothetical protein NTX91_05305 [candidate division SR1 bacterium]|nr:hypothetical protein [candidate division SR1 bacterium]
MLGFHLSKFVKEDFKTILKHFWGKLFGVSILIGFLLFLLNIFLGVGFYANHFSADMKDKLGMYFYIKEDTGGTDTLYQEVMLMKDELTKQGLNVTFSTKDDALSFLQKKIPDVVDNFKKFGIDNPLPATLYVMFSTDAQYEAMKATIIKHKDIILNVKDVDSGATIKQQENRILTTINFSNLVVIMAYCIIALILVIVFTFLGFLLKTIFSSLHKEFEVKKLLGASHLDVTKSFVMITLDIIIFAFFVCGVLLILSGITLNIFLMNIFQISLISVLANSAILLVAFIVEMIVVGGIGIFLAYSFTNTLHKQLPIVK